MCHHNYTTDDQAEAFDSGKVVVVAATAVVNLLLKANHAYSRVYANTGDWIHASSCGIMTTTNQYYCHYSLRAFCTIILCIREN